MDGYKFVGASTDDVETGSLQLTGDAVKNHVTKGTTFYTVDPKNSLTGTLEPGNVSNLILSVSSGRNITVQWTNPIEELGRPYSGVYIRYQTGSYPTPDTGIEGYKGVGTSQESGGISTTALSLPSLDTMYYFIVYSYCVTSNGEILGTQLKATVNTGSSQIITIKATSNYTIPAGYSKIDVFCVGGGGGSEYGDSSYYANGGGGAGYTKTVNNITVAEKDVLSITIGGGGYGGNKGGTTTVKKEVVHYVVLMVEMETLDLIQQVDKVVLVVVAQIMGPLGLKVVMEVLMAVAVVVVVLEEVEEALVAAVPGAAVEVLMAVGKLVTEKLIRAVVLVEIIKDIFLQEVQVLF